MKGFDLAEELGRLVWVLSKRGEWRAAARAVRCIKAFAHHRNYIGFLAALTRGRR